MTTLFKGETIRNKGLNREAGKFLARVIAHKITIERTEQSLIARLPLGVTEATDDLSITDAQWLASARARMLQQGWRETQDEAMRDAERERDERIAGRLKFSGPNRTTSLA